MPKREQLWSRRCSGVPDSDLLFHGIITKKYWPVIQRASHNTVYGIIDELSPSCFHRLRDEARVEDARTRVDEKRAIREKLGYMERVRGKRERKKEERKKKEGEKIGREVRINGKDERNVARRKSRAERIKQLVARKGWRTEILKK